MFEKPYIELIHPRTNKSFQLLYGWKEQYQDSFCILYTRKTKNYLLILKHNLKKESWEAYFHSTDTEIISIPNKTAQISFEQIFTKIENQAKIYQSLINEFIE